MFNKKYIKNEEYNIYVAINEVEDNKFIGAYGEGTLRDACEWLSKHYDTNEITIKECILFSKDETVHSVASYDFCTYKLYKKDKVLKCLGLILDGLSGYPDIDFGYNPIILEEIEDEE